MKPKKTGRATNVRSRPKPVECIRGCGCCCHPVLLPYSQVEALSYEISPENQRWVQEDLTPMHPREARRLAPWYFDTIGLVGVNAEEAMPFFYSCRHFNTETRECMNYDNRPEVCRDYPKTNGVMILPGSALPSPCSFNQVLGVEPTPLDQYLERIRQLS